MSNIGDPIGQFTINAAFIMFHNHRFDPASRGRYIMRLPDRTLVWLDDYEQRLREFQSKPVSAALRDEKAGETEELILPSANLYRQG